MSIQQVNGGWKVDFRAGGANGKRYRKTCKTKAEAERYQKFVESKLIADGKPWEPKPQDTRRLLELIESWYQLHGQYLSDGLRRKSKLILAANALKNPIGHELKALDYTRYRAKRKESGIADKTLNNELGYLRAFYNSLKKLGEIDYANPLAEIEQIKLYEKELSYLTHEQIDELMLSIEKCKNPHVELIVLVSLCTGGRWGEVEALTTRQIRDNKVTFINTKSKKNRSIPIPEWLCKKLIEHSKLTNNTNIFTSSLSSFSKALKRTNIELPKGQAAHVLRHTFASHFMMNGGNILTLQKALGHSDIRVTMRYAHLAPDHLNDALLLNPVEKMAFKNI